MRIGTAAVALGLALVSAGGVTAAVVGVEEPQPSRLEATALPALGLPPLRGPVAPPPRPARLPVATPEPAPTPVPPPSVTPLGELQAPDLLVTLEEPLTADQVARLEALSGLTGLAVVDTGSVTVAGEPARVLGVDPSGFRAFTPQETAQSDPLWAAVARGEVVTSYALARTRELPLGEDVTVTGDTAGDTAVTDRVGALASIGLPGVDLVVDRASAAAYGVVPRSGVVVSAPERAVSGLTEAVEDVLGDSATVTVLRPEPVAVQGRPASYRELYVKSAERCPGLSWTVLAAIGQVESGHGRNNGPSTAGALGPMQFLPSTWAFYGVDGDGDGTTDINSPFDAVPAAAGYLCRNGGGRGGDALYDAVFAYNHLDSYVQKVLALAAQYR